LRAKYCCSGSSAWVHLRGLDLEPPDGPVGAVQRAKLKRLVTRGVLTEDQPGLFTLAPSTAGPADATVA
jgi:hypothetical protein